MSECDYIRRRMQLQRIAVEDDLDQLHPPKHECIRGSLNGKPTTTHLTYRTPEERAQLLAIGELARNADRCGRILRRFLPPA